MALAGVALELRVWRCVCVGVGGVGGCVRACVLALVRTSVRLLK